MANNAALVATYAGAESLAWTLCEQHCTWQGRRSRQARDGAIAAFGVQPWVNLGRLAALSGNWEAALARYALLLQYRAGRAIELDQLRIDSTAWQALTPSERDFRLFLESVYVLDSLRVLLAGCHVGQVGPFCEAAGDTVDPGFRRFFKEAVTVAAGLMGDHERACRSAAEALRTAEGWERVVFTVRLAETYSDSGSTSKAVSTLLPLMTVATRLSTKTRADVQVLPVLLRVCTLGQELGAADHAAAAAQSVYDGARRAGDQIIEIESLRVLAAISPARDRAGWRAALDRLEKSTEYRRYRRGCEPMATCSNVMAELCSELQDVFAA